MAGHPALRRASGVVLAVALAGLTVAVGTRLVDLVTPALAAVQALVPISAAGLLTVFVLAVLLRHRRVALVGAAPALVALVLLAVPFRSVAVPPSDGQLTVMSANLEYGGADPSQLVSAVRARSAGVLVLAEVTPRALERLDAAGLTTLLPYAAGTAEEGASGTVIRSRYPLTPLGSDQPARDGGPGFRSPLARVERPGAPFLLKAVHTYPPTAGPQGWADDLATLTELRRRETTTPLVLAGDFNGGDDHPAYRRMAAGMTDVHRAAGAGWVRTWPHGWRVPPFVQLDHVLVRGFETVAAGTVTLDGTDHAAVWGTVR